MIFLPQSLQHQRMAGHMGDLAAKSFALSDTGWITAWALSAVVFPYLFELIVWKCVLPKQLTKKLPKHLRFKFHRT